MNSKSIVYISGPMTIIGPPTFNYPAFHRMERILKRRFKCKVLNPANSFGGAKNLSLHLYLRHDGEMLLQATDVVFLDGWRMGKNTHWEYATARAYGLNLWTQDFHDLRMETTLEEAWELVYGSREAAYDHPIYDFTRQAKIWSAVLAKKLTEDIDATEVGLCMIGVKLAREAFKHNRDSLVDIAGYAECVQKIHDKRSKIKA